MRFSQIIFSILPLAITSLALPTTSPGTLSPRQDPPSVILPSPPTSQPAGSTLVQVGFDQALNYNFVANSPATQSQIFSLLPQGIAFGLNIDASQVVMESLRPLDTTEDLGYTTTLARFWIPSGQTAAFQSGIHSPGSAFYNNPDATVKELMAHINGAISTQV